LCLPSVFNSRSALPDVPACRMVREPRAVLQEFGTVVDPGVELRVHDSTAVRCRQLVVAGVGGEGGG
jgi:hypothetical protein